VLPQEETAQLHLQVVLGTGIREPELERDVVLDMSTVIFASPPGDEPPQFLLEGYTYRIAGDRKVTATATPGVTRIEVTFPRVAVTIATTTPSGAELAG